MQDISCDNIKNMYDVCMKTENMVVLCSNGEQKTFTVAVPDTLEEFITLFGPDKTFKYARRSYLADCRIRFKFGRSARAPKKKLTIELSKLTKEQRDILEALELI